MLMMPGMSEKRAAVSGATGFIGSAVVRQLLAQNRPVRALLEPGADSRNIDGLDIERITVDVCDHTSMTRALEDCSAYYHLAAIYQLWVPKRGLIYRVNVEGTTASLLAAQKAGVERIIYTSSIAAIGLREDRTPADESVPFNLYDIADDYVLTKHLSERVALRFAQAGMPIVVVNPAFPFGERDSAPTPTGSIVLSTLRGEVPVLSAGGFCAIDIDDVAKAHVAAETRGRVGERYILGDHNVSFADFIKLVCELAQRKPPRITVPPSIGNGLAFGMEMWAKHVSHKVPTVTWRGAKYMQRHAWFDSAKARRELGLGSTPLVETVQRSIAYFRDSGMV